MFEKTLIHPSLWLLAAIAVALAFFLPPSAMAQATSASELFEEAVFQEETAGDLDAAIEIYQRIADDAEVRRSVAARALYRLYRCYERQGDDAEADRVLGRLRKRYPDSEELLAGDAEDLPRPLTLEDAPWPEDEIQLLITRMTGGAEVGPLITSAHRAVVEGEEIWRLGVRRSYSSDRSSVVVEVRREDMTPLSSSIRSDRLGRFEVAYLPGEMVVHTFGQDGGSRERTVKTGRQLYDAQTFYHLLRRLPLEVGYKTALPLVDVFGTVTDPTVEVTSRERVEVAAGAFDCFRLEVPLAGYTVYVASGPRRELVKLDAQGLTLELVATTRRRVEPFTYHDPDLAFSVRLPAGWHAYRLPDRPRHRVHANLLDPEARVFSAVNVFPRAPQYAPGTQNFLGRLAGKVINANRALRVREESWQVWQAGGRPAISWISDDDTSGVPRVRHDTVLVGETHVMGIASSTTPEALDDLIGTLREIAGGVAF